MDTSGFCKGIDVNHWDGRIDWRAAMVQGGVRFAFVKATEFTTDPAFADNWQRLGALGLTRGTYDFFHGEKDPIQQADAYVAAVQAAGGECSSDLPYVLDLERGSILAFSGSRGQFVARAHQCLARLQQALPASRKPLVYCSPGFADEWLDDSFGDYPLWVAHYGVPAPRLPRGWKSWAFWQYGAGEDGTHRLPGCLGSVDVNWFAGSHDALVAAFGLVTPGAAAAPAAVGK